MAQPNPPAAAVSAKPDVPNIPQGGDDGKATTNSSKEVSSTNPPRWDMFPLRIATAGEPVTVEIPRSASIPSPVADCGERRNQLLKFVNERASRGVRTLFNKIREAGNPQPGGLTLKQIMLVGSLSEISPLSSDRENGFIVYLGEQRAHSLEQHQSEDRGIDAEVRQEWVQDNYMLRLYSDAADPTYYQPPARRSSVLARLTSPLDIRRLSGASSAGKAITGFFVLNSSHTPLRINGVLFNPNALVGPLPDFAVIEVGKAAVFWWHTNESLNYVPAQNPETTANAKRPLDLDEENMDLTDMPPSKRQKINEETAAPGDQTEFGLPATAPENEPTLCPDLPSNGFIINIVSNQPTEAGHLPKAGSTTNHLPVQDNQGPDARLNGSKPFTTTPSSGLVAWRQHFQRRLRYYEERAGEQPNGREQPHQITVQGDFGDDDAALAIASVWEGANRKGINYAFGTTYLFQTVRQDPLPGVTCVGAPNPLIMPLIFDRRVNNPAEEEESYVKPAPPTKPSKQSSKDEEELAKADDMAARVKKLKDKGGVNQGSKSSATASQQEAQKQRVGGVNHFVLAVAERDSGSEDGVRMTYINSASTPLMNILRATARNIVRNSSWMSEGVWPRFTAEVMQRVPQQVSGSVCGTHVVLNAWAYMLNIRINATWSTSSDEKSYFYMEARTVINLALRGLMDSETILSFLTSYGYAHYQSPDQIPQRPRGIRSVFMNVDIFDDIVDRMRRAERHRGKITSTGPSRGSPSGSTTGHAPGGSGGSSNPPRVLHVPPKTNPPLLPPKAKSPLLPPKQNPPLLPPKGLTNPPKTAPPTIILPISLLPKAGATPTGNPTGGVAPITVAVPFEGTRQKTWAGLLREGIRDCQNKRVNLGKHNFYQFGKKNQQLLDEDVHFPIAAVWRGLWMNNIRFAFGAADVFRLCRQPDKSGHGLLSVGAPHPLIIPLIFNSDDDQVAAHLLNIKTGQFRSLNGHFMLAVAERESQSSLNVRLRIMDSAPGFVDITIIRAAAQNIVRFSGWMGLTRAGTPMTVRPTFTEEIIRVPRQTSQITCGLHVVFNAWAYMLGMQITPNEFLKSRSTTNDLYKNGRELIDLATNGCLNVQMIQALLNRYGYCQPQSLQDLILPIQTVGINAETLYTIVDEIQAETKVQAYISGPHP